MDVHHILRFNTFTHLAVIAIYISLILFIIKMANHIDTHNMDDITDHPLFPQNEPITALQALLEMDGDTASDNCDDALQSHQMMISQNNTFFENISKVWKGLSES